MDQDLHPIAVRKVEKGDKYSDAGAPVDGHFASEQVTAFIKDVLEHPEKYKEFIATLPKLAA